MSERVSEALAALGSAARPKAPLGAQTTYRVGGTAAVGFVARSTEDLHRVSQVSAQTGLDVLAVGRGSNMVVADAGYVGIALWLEGDFEKIDWPQTDSQADASELELSAGAAVALPVLARQCAAKGLSGLSWAVGVPGSVGGAVRMNAGGHGGDVATSLVSAQLFDLASQSLERVPAQSLGLGYRVSSVGPTQIVVAASFACRRSDSEQLATEIAEIVQWRRDNQPGGQNAGSVFKNPSAAGNESTHSAGALIDRAGLKGLRVGGAHVSQVHANFIVADDGATAKDVVSLIDRVALEVKQRCGVDLEPELRLVGFDDR